MGQQQLLLLVLGIVIVGLAVVVGIKAFSENSFRARQDQYTAEAVAIGAEIIAWQLRPGLIGGNDNQADVSALSFSALGRPQDGEADGASYIDRDGGRYSVDGQTPGRPLVTVQDLPGEVGDVMIEVAIYGPDQACWATRYRYHDGSSFTDPTGTLDNPDAGACVWAG